MTRYLALLLLAPAIFAQTANIATMTAPTANVTSATVGPAAASGITLEAVTSYRVVDTSVPQVNTHTITNTLSNGYVVLAVAMYDGSDAAIDTTPPDNVEFDGDDLGLLAEHNVDYFGEIRVYLFGAAVGSKAAGTYNVSVYSTSGLDDYNIGVMTFNGVHQTVSVGTATDGDGTTSPAAVTVTSATGELVVGVVIKGDKTGSPTSGETELWDTVTTPADTGWGGSEPGAASVSFSCTLSADAQWCMTAIPLKPL